MKWLWIVKSGPGDVKNGNPALLNDQGNMCCLGFLGKVCGYSDKTLQSKDSPEEIKNNKKWPKSLIIDKHNNSDICRALMKANDRTKEGDSKKEERIKTLGVEAGIKFKFVN